MAKCLPIEVASCLLHINLLSRSPAPSPPHSPTTVQYYEYEYAGANGISSMSAVKEACETLGALFLPWDNSIFFPVQLLEAIFSSFHLFLPPEFLRQF